MRNGAIGRLVRPPVTSSAMIDPTIGPSAKPCAEKPKAWNTPALVALGPIATDQSDFHTKYEPGHPAADPTGMVKYPNINPMIEMTDMRDAQRSYEANTNVISATRRMVQRTLDILRG